MKKMRFVLIAFIVAVFSLVAVLSCDTSEGKDPTEADIAKFVEIMTFFGDVLEGEPPCVDFDEGETATSYWETYTFNDCDFEGIGISGSMTLTGTMVSETQFTLNFSGTLNFTGEGAPASSVSFDFTITITGSYPDFSYAMSGTITIDGETFKASGFMDEFLTYYMY